MMNYRLFVLFSTLLVIVSCSKEGESEETIIIAGKELTSITHVFYNYVYEDLPATRTFTSTYTLNDAKINAINSSVFHYWHEEPSRNYTAYDESTFSYDSNSRLIKVVRENYSEFDETDTNIFTYEFDYYENDKIKSVAIKNDSDVLTAMYTFVYQNNTFEEVYEYYDNGAMIFYDEKVYQLDSQQRIYRTAYKSGIFEGMDPTTITPNTQEASFNDEGNVYQTFFNDSPFEEYEYSDIKIPADIPNISLPFHGYIPFHIVMAQFDRIVQSYNTNYIKTILPLEPTNPYIITYKNKLSKDNYPLKIDVYSNDKITSETEYTYE